MRITYKGDYAMKVILELSLNYGKLLTIHDLADRLHIPIKFLEQLLLSLKRGKFVESRRGKIGGYLLAKHPSRIILGDVVRFIDGPIEPIACVNHGYTACEDIKTCVFKNIWKEVADATKNIIDVITFEDLVNRTKTSKECLSYEI